MRLLYVNALGVALLLCGCATKPIAQIIPAPPQGPTLAPDDLRRVRTPEAVRTYYVGRLPDADRRGMREAGSYYVLAKSSDWDLRNNQIPLRASGPLRSVVDPTYVPMPTDAAVSAEIERQKLAAKRAESAAMQAEILNAQLRADTRAMAKAKTSVLNLRGELEHERAARQQAEEQNAALRAQLNSSSATPSIPDPVPATVDDSHPSENNPFDEAATKKPTDFPVIQKHNK